jgi:hypothetical protein
VVAAGPLTAAAITEAQEETLQVDLELIAVATMPPLKEGPAHLLQEGLQDRQVHQAEHRGDLDLVEMRIQLILAVVAAAAGMAPAGHIKEAVAEAHPVPEQEQLR